ncbi:MAG: DNA polymerase III subunit beta [Clostridiales bacterium]|nr:DNA polymerase III subunit beta [Clostridiales bacterium]
MKVICQGLELSDAVLKVTKALNSKNVTPILEGIKITAKNDSLVLFATDLELAIEKKINAEVLLEGEVVVPGRFFADMVKMLTNEQIELSLDDNLRLKIKYTDGEIEKQCFSVEEYPEIEKLSDCKSFSIVSKEFKDLISKTIFSVSTDDARPTLKGCLFEAEEFTISSVALDGYRLALVKKPLENKVDEKIKVIVPARSLSELNKFLDDSEDIVQVKIENNFLMVDLGHSCVMTRLLSGDFINYKQIIPNDFDTNVIINKDQFKSSLDRAAILSRGEKNNLVKLDVKEETLHIVSNSDDGANLHEIVAINLVGKDMTIAFNSRYLLDCTRVIDDEFVKINLNTPVNPCVITPCDKEDYLYLILPVRMV